MASFNVFSFMKSRAAVGVTVGAGGLRAVRVARTENGPMVEKAWSLDFSPDREPLAEDGDAEIRAIAADLANQKTRIVAGLRSSQAGIHFFTVPFDRVDKVQKVLRFEAESYFLASPEGMMFDFLPLPPHPGEERPGLVFGARSEAVGEVLEYLAQAGIEPRVILPESLALIETGRTLFQDRPDQGFHLLLDLGARQTGMALFEDGRPIMVRSVFYGGRDVTSTAAKALNREASDLEKAKREIDLFRDRETDLGQALAQGWQPVVREIERSLAGALTGRLEAEPVLVLGGGGALAPGLAPWLSECMGFPVQTLEDFLGGDPARTQLTSETLVPFGLGMLALKPGYTPNLRQGEHSPRQALMRYRLPLAAMAGLLLLLLAFNLGGLVYSYRTEAQKYRTVKSRIEALFRETVPGVSKVIAPKEQMRQEVAALAGVGLTPGGDRVLDLLMDVSRLAGGHQDIRITGFNLNPQTMEIQGEGGSYEVIDLLKTELENLPFFSEVTLGGARMDPTTRVLTFKISLKRKAG